MGRPAKKRAYVESKARRKGELQAELEYHKKKPLMEILKDHLSHMIDNTNLLDVAAVATGTVLIHGLILASPQLKQQTLNFIPIGLLGAAGIPYTLGTIAWQQLFPNQTEPLKDDWPYWIAAIFISIVLVKYGGQIIGLLDKNLSVIVGAMLA